MKNIIVRHSIYNNPSICEFLSHKYGFQEIHFTEDKIGIVNKKQLLKDLLSHFFFVLKSRKQMNHSDIIFCIGYIAIPVKFLIKLRLIRCNRFFWFSFFLHSPRWFPVFRMLSSVLAIPNEQYILFSKHEVDLYHRSLGIDVHKLTYIPYGHFDGPAPESDSTEPDYHSAGEYYFAGGYSNRDYQALVDVFRERSEKLVIVASRLNRELLEMEIPNNIHVEYDIPLEQFEIYLKGAKACLLIMRHNTGASGQDFIRRCIRNNKAVIASENEVIKEYIEHGISGLIMDNPRVDLPEILDNSLIASDKLETYAKNAKKRYDQHFSNNAIAERLSSIINSALAGCNV